MKEKVKLIDVDLKDLPKEANRYFFWRKCKLTFALFMLYIKNYLKDVWK